MEIIGLPALTDNYIWVIVEDKEVIVVDPGTATPVLEFLTTHQYSLLAIILTHGHDDHVGGVELLKEYSPGVKVYGPIEVEHLVDEIVVDASSFYLNEHRFEVNKTAGHTKEHVSFLMDDTYLFCGDALFSGGCGRVFTRDYLAQYQALKYFESLEDHVKVYAGHEYTLTNLKFANHIESDNLLLHSALQMVEQLRSKNVSTLPSTIGLERDINLMMTAKTLEEFIQLRNARDQF